MIPESLIRKLAGNERPEASAGLEQELAAARAKGYKVPNLDISLAVITVQQARSALSRLQIDEKEVFSEIMLRYRAFPLGSGGELLDLEQILERSSCSNWSVDYPDFSARFLELSTGEGEGSFLYERSTGFVFNVDWNAMRELLAGELAPTWTSYSAFLGWYYDIEPT